MADSLERNYLKSIIPQRERKFFQNKSMTKKYENPLPKTLKE